MDCGENGRRLGGVGVELQVYGRGDGSGGAERAQGEVVKFRFAWWLILTLTLMSLTSPAGVKFYVTSAS